MFKLYYNLAKPGIIYGNAIATIAGFFLASVGQINLGLLLATLAGISLVIGSGCVFNNLLDRDIDQKMERTKSRALASGAVSSRNAVIYAICLLLSGLFLLYFFANGLAMAVALAGFLVYVGVYSPLKRMSFLATLVGSIAGAVPPVVGYTAVSNRLDIGALILFLILVFWQMPHFYSIAIFRLDDYAKAEIPVLPLKWGIFFTKLNILVFIIGFILVASSLTGFGLAGYVYLATVGLAGLIWLSVCLVGLMNKMEDKLWARRMFFLSLVVLLVVCLAISFDSIIL